MSKDQVSREPETKAWKRAPPDGIIQIKTVTKKQIYNENSTIVFPLESPFHFKQIPTREQTQYTKKPTIYPIRTYLPAAATYPLPLYALTISSKYKHGFLQNDYASLLMQLISSPHFLISSLTTNQLKIK